MAYDGKPALQVGPRIVSGLSGPAWVTSMQDLRRTSQIALSGWLADNADSNITESTA